MDKILELYPDPGPTDEGRVEFDETYAAIPKAKRVQMARDLVKIYWDRGDFKE